ncbi:MAG: RCC1 domain-containing protein [Rhodanobacteraceae bacterium]
MQAKSFSRAAAVLVAVAGMIVGTAHASTARWSAEPITRTPAGIPHGIRQISAGDYTACAIRSDGALYCWGDNRFGQVGTGTASNAEPNPVKLLDGASDVAVEASHGCAVVHAGLWCWGSNTGGQVDPAQPATATPGDHKPLVLKPTRILNDGVTQVAVGTWHTCAIVDGGLQCWGTVLTAPSVQQIHPEGAPGRRLVFANGVTAVAAGILQTCAIVKGALWCWGRNQSGELGNGKTGTGLRGPVKVFDHGVTAVAVGRDYACAVAAHALKCWGAIQNRYPGIYGAGTAVPDPRVIIPDHVRSVSAGDYHACAILTGGKLQCWGWSPWVWSSNGDLHYKHGGESQSAPATVIDAGVTAVAAGNGFTCALVGGALRCRGYDAYGSALVGDGSAHASFADGSHDVRQLDELAHLDAQRVARLPGEAAGYLQGKVIAADHTIYFVTKAAASPGQDARVWNKAGKLVVQHSTRLTFDVIGLFNVKPPDAAPASGGAATPDLIAQNATCGETRGADTRLDSPTFAVLQGTHFVTLDTATAGRFQRMPKYVGLMVAPDWQLDSSDLARLQACTARTQQQLAALPFRGITINTGYDAKDAYAIPTNLHPDVYIGIPDHHEQTGRYTHLQSIKLQPKHGASNAYTVTGKVDASMQCGDYILDDWKHAVSGSRRLFYRDGAFYNTIPFKLVEPAFPAYTQRQLDDAIHAAQRHDPGDHRTIDPATCAPVLTEEVYTIRRGDKPVKTLHLFYANARPLPPLDCDGDPATFAVYMANKLGYPGIGDADHAVCKATPDDPGTTIVALSWKKRGSGYADDDRSGDYNLDVMLVDTASRTVEARWRQQDAYTSDAYAFGGIAIDTGRYWLARNIRAFGVTAYHSLSSHMVAGNDTVLNLFVRRGDKLQAVIRDMTIESMSESGDSSCPGGTEHSASTLSVAGTIHNGLKDLRVTTVSALDPPVSGHPACGESSSTDHGLLEFDGDQYRAKSLAGKH